MKVHTPLRGQAAPRMIEVDLFGERKVGQLGSVDVANGECLIAGLAVAEGDATFGEVVR